MLHTQSYFHTGEEKFKITSHVKCKVWSSTSAIVLTNVRAQILEPAEPPVLGACKKEKFIKDGDEPFSGTLGNFKAV